MCDDEYPPISPTQTKKMMMMILFVETGLTKTETVHLHRGEVCDDLIYDWCCSGA